MSFAGTRGGYGKVVIVRHADGVETRYAHCDGLDVAVGDVVRAGQQVGRVGSTGRSTGPHLHLEARLEGVAHDPERLLGADLEKVLKSDPSPSEAGRREVDPPGRAPRGDT